jgi:hypothetical protein
MKNETNHTPGPWHVGAGNGEGAIFAESGRIRLEQGGTTLYPVANIGMGWSAAEDTANAHLISAAPELLDALFNALPYVEDVLDNPEQLACFKAGVVERHAKAIRAAIAKATGG